jgi:hypothetical protein
MRETFEIGKDALQELVLFVPHLEQVAPHHRQR